VAKKRLMLLGGIRYLLPVIKTAHELGVEVITADYLPNNIAHKYSDTYVNVSILDRDAVLKAAQELKIDGIMSFGVDPGVVTAAYVADKMGLAYPPLESCEILQNKDKFRDFLATHGFNCPFHKGYDNKATALSEADSFAYPVIVKPVDSAGSKGVTRVDSADKLEVALDTAFEAAHNGRIIIEQFLELVGHQTGSDSFSIDNELVFASFDSQYFDASAPNGYAPSAHIWPSDMAESVQVELASELQRLIKLLNLGTSIYNIEARVATDGKPYIMEVSPRGGGNRLSEVLKLATGQDLISNNVRMALRLPVEPITQPKYDGAWVDFVIHSNKTGRFAGVTISDSMRAHVKEACLYVKHGDSIKAFSGANQAIGTLFMQFGSRHEAETAVLDASKWLRVGVL